MPQPKKERLEKTLHCEAHGGSPLYMPAIYEHKAWFIHNTPSNVSRDTGLLTQALMTEFEQIGPDALAIGVDVYNLEAEAAGCRVTFYEGDDTSIPGIQPGNHILKVGDDLTRFPIPNPLKDGRMPINIEATRRIVKSLDGEVWIRGSISGPFSLAISLMGAEDLFMATLDAPAFVHDILAYAGRIIREFGKAYIDVGADVIMFDSQASPDLLSPEMYREFVLPVMQDLITTFNDKGVKDVPLIIGGNTTRLIDELIATGANNLLCDFTADWPQWLAGVQAANRAVRRNMNPIFIQTATPDDIYATAIEVLADSAAYPGFIMGTAVVPYGTPVENLLAIKQACHDSVNL